MSNLEKYGIKDCKIYGETYIENQKDFEKRLLQTTKVNNLSEAYQKQNKKIDYKLT